MSAAVQGPDLSPYTSCRLCPRNCGVNRVAGERGVCGEEAVCRVASWGPHYGEEPCFSGTRGSGTIFFSGCSSGCFFCQNYQISAEHHGRDRTPEDLLQAALEMAAGPDAVHNINFVTPDHFWPHVRWLAQRLRQEGVTLPLLFNGSGYERPELVPEYAEWMDIFLPDFKFADPALAKRVMGDARYPELVLASLRKMVELKGFLSPWDPTGRETARQGVLVRHLILPGEVENSLAVLSRLRQEFGPLLPLSVMSQFRPVPACAGRGDLARRISGEEHVRVIGHAEALGFRHLFIQQHEDSADFMPDFRADHVFRGNREIKGKKGTEGAKGAR